jgi:hypothetical protein
MSHLNIENNTRDFIILMGIALIATILSPIYGTILWFMSIGIICLARILFIKQSTMSNRHIFQTSIRSWALLASALIVTKMLTYEQNVMASIYSIIISMIMIGIMLAAESYDTGNIEELTIIDILSTAVHYMVITTVLTLVSVTGLYVLTGGSMETGFYDSIRYGSFYVQCANLLVMQISAIITIHINSKIHNWARDYYTHTQLFPKI